MDLSHLPTGDDAAFPALRALAAARAAVSPTALAQARLPAADATHGGPFDGLVAAALRGWAQGERAVYPATSGGVEGHGARPGRGVEGGFGPARGQK